MTVVGIVTIHFRDKLRRAVGIVDARARHVAWKATKGVVNDRNIVDATFKLLAAKTASEQIGRCVKTPSR